VIERGGHILIVDDTPKNIQVLGGILRDAGYDINVATDGRAALDSLARVIPDLVLLDVIMPEMDGFQVCRRMKEDPNLAEIPVIFLTAKVETDDIVRGFDLGAVDYVTKPFRSAELLKRVDTHMTLSRLRSELGARVGELSSALSQIEQLHREQDSFLRHELNNVINPIAGYTDLLRAKISGDLDEKQLGWLNSITRGASSMQTMLGEMKKLQDFERGEHKLNTMAVPIHGILSDIVKDVALIMENRVDIELSSEREDARVAADLSFLPGVFKNLIKNAAEHVVSLTDQERSVRVDSLLNGTSVVISIANGGEPIPEDRLATFFEKFNSTKGGSGGTGLGTSYARLVTLAHGGLISVQSSRVEGTVVRVTLPLADG